MSLTKKVYLTISGYDIKLSDNLMFYQKDQLKLIFYINEYGIDYENNATTRALMPVNPLNAILFIENPEGVDSVSSAKIEDNAVTFYLDSTHTQYVGVSRMQLRLFDQDGCAITLPHFTFEIRENIYGSGDVRFQNVVMVDHTGTVILTEDNDMLDVGDILTMGTEVAYPQVAKTIKDLPIKHGLDGTEKLIVEDNEATKQAPLTTIVDEIKQNSQEKIREIESELAQTNAQLSNTYRYASQITNDYNGICVRTWNSGDLDSDRYRGDLLNLLKKCGANSISLTVNTYQPTKSDNNPFSRVPVSLEEIERYLMYLKENHIRVMFKHHVEIDTNNYVWRAEINPTDADTWFTNYKKGLIEYAKLCEKYSVEVFSVGSEYRTLTKNHSEKWVEVIDAVKEHYKGLLTYGANLNNDERDELHYIKFWDKLDFIGVDFYLYPFNDWSLTQNQYEKGFYHTSNHKNSVLLVERVANIYGKPVLYCEYGKLTSSDRNGRNNYIKAFQSTFLTKNYNGGAFIWVYDPQPTSWFEDDPELISILNDTPKIKNIDIEKVYSTPKSEVSSSNYSKIMSCDLSKTYSEAFMEIDFFVRGLTNLRRQHKAKATIKISNHDTVNPKVQCELDGYGFTDDSVIYTINNSLVEFYVKVPQFTWVEYKFNSNEIGLFNLFDYQGLKNVSGTNSSLRFYKKYSTELSIIEIDGFKMAFGKKTVTMTGGSFSTSFTIENASHVLFTCANVDSVNGGNREDVVVNAQYVGSDSVKISGKHMSIDGDYACEVSCFAIYR